MPRWTGAPPPRPPAEQTTWHRLIDRESKVSSFRRHALRALGLLEKPGSGVGEQSSTGGHEESCAAVKPSSALTLCSFDSWAGVRERGLLSSLMRP